MLNVNHFIVQKHQPFSKSLVSGMNLAAENAKQVNKTVMHKVNFILNIEIHCKPI